MDIISERKGSRTSWKNALLVSIMALFIAIAANTGRNIAAAADAVRVTTSFDVKYASAVLHQVTRLFTAGFGRAEADHVARDIDALKPDQPKVWQFVVQYQGKTEPLEIRGLMDDLGMIDLDFAASPAAAPAVRAVVDSYLNGRGH
jgi:hypothetical protein